MAGPLPLGDPAPLDGLLPEQSAIGSADRTFHAYVHIPFCRVRCGYCDFNTYTANELEGVSQASFADKLIAEIGLSTKVLSQSGLPTRELASIFFGGGTPTQLPASDLVRILDALKTSFGFLADCEITTEANPDNVDVPYLEELVAGGFNRISFGMQSAVPEVLATLERTHDPENVDKAVAAAKSVGLQTSVDLIYGAPGETVAQWRESLEQAISLDTDHVSAYALIVEDGTKLARQIRSGQLEEVDEDLQADKYELADKILGEAGFNWYEISNWSKSQDAASAHNLAYWRGQDWWGYGPGAHSHVGGVRWWNVKHPSAYSNRISEGSSPAAGRETLDERVRLEERVLLEMRIRAGMAIETLKSVNNEAPKIIAGLIADQMIEPAAAMSGRLVLTLRGRLLADSIVRQFLA